MKRLLPLLFLAAGFHLPANAVEYRTVESATVLYDAPSQKGGKLFVIRRDTPVEVVVGLEGWSKVRDSEGGLAWVEKKFLSEKRSVIVTADRAGGRHVEPAGWIIAGDQRARLIVEERCRDQRQRHRGRTEQKRDAQYAHARIGGAKAALGPDRVPIPV